MYYVTNGPSGNTRNDEMCSTKQWFDESLICSNYEGTAGPSYSRRLYLNDGMIPKYTGYLPRKYY